MNSNSISLTDLLATARDVLGKNGFSEVLDYRLEKLDANSNLLFEDAYSLVAIVVYETWNDLDKGWIEAQTSFVELISMHIAKEERKSWEGYLLLWTTDFVPIAEVEERQRIQYNTGRVRKLVASGENLKQVANVEAALLPLLPITENFTQEVEDGIFERIPELLATEEMAKEKIKVVVEAFKNQESAMESLHRFGSEE